MAARYIVQSIHRQSMSMRRRRPLFPLFVWSFFLLLFSSHLFRLLFFWFASSCTSFFVFVCELSPCSLQTWGARDFVYMLTSFCLWGVSSFLSILRLLSICLCTVIFSFALWTVSFASFVLFLLSLAVFLGFVVCLLPPLRTAEWRTAQRD